MTPILDKATRIRCLQDLGVVVPDDFVAIQKAPIAESQKLLTALKTKVKHNFHRLCLVLHPDVNGGDAAKTERFKLLAMIKAEVDKIDVHHEPRPPVVHVSMPVGTPFQRAVPFRGPTVYHVVSVPLGIKVPL